MIRWLLTISIFSFVLTGCYGLKDIDKRFFVLAIGVDKSDDETKPYLVTLNLAIPSPKIEPGQTNRSQLLSQKGATISEALRLMKGKVDKELDFGMTKIIIIGKSLAAENISKPMDWFYRRRDIQLIGYVAVGDPSAKAILSVSPKSERLPGNALNLSFGKEGVETPLIVTEYLYDFFKRTKERGKDPYMPVVKAAEETYHITRVAVFDKKKMKSILPPEETRIFYEMVRGFSRFELVTELDKTKFVMLIDKFKAKYKLRDIKSARPTAGYTIKMEGIVEESSDQLYNKNWKDLNLEAGKQSGERIRKLLTHLRDEGVDPVGFGLRYRAMGHVSEEEWKSWEEHYPNLQFDVDVKVELKSSGVIK